MRPRRILVVDDEPILVRLLQRALAAHGYEVEGAADGREALAMLDEMPVDLILSDVRMPVMDGPALLAALRERPQAPPLIFITGYGDHTDSQLRAMGAVEVHAKPLPAQTLVDIVRRNLESAPR